MKFKIFYQENNRLKNITVYSNSIEELKNSSQYPSNIIKIQTPISLKKRLLHYSFINKKDIYELFHQMSIMLNSNINISETIALLLNMKQKQTIIDILNIIQNSIQTSQPIEIGLQKYNKELGETTILFLKFGIENGNIKESISSLVEINEQNNNISTKLKDILRYPLILFSSLIIAIAMIFVYVIPNFQYIFELLGDNLPLATRLLLFMQEIIENYFYLFLIIPFIIYLIAINLYKKHQLFFDKIIILNIPIVSKLIQSYLFYKLFLSITIIVKSKYKFQDAIKNSKNILKNRYVQKSLDQIIKDIKNGSSIEDAFKNRRLFDDLTIKLLYTAQYTNNYEKVLNDITNLYKERFSNSIKNFSSIIEPTIILFISLIVLWLVLAIMVPMWNMGSAIS